MNDLIFATIAVVGLVLAFGLPSLLRRKTKNRQNYERCAEVFFDKIDPLLSDPDTPAEVIDVISGMNKLVTDSGGVRYALRALLRASAAAERDESNKTYAEVVAPFFARRPELAAAFSEAAMSSFPALRSKCTKPRSLLNRRS